MLMVDGITSTPSTESPTAVCTQQHTHHDKRHALNVHGSDCFPLLIKIIDNESSTLMYSCNTGKDVRAHIQHSVLTEDYY
eukprot:1681326-Pyramimonas_sp.AAC.1